MLEGHLAQPSEVLLTDRPAVIFVHGYPSDEVWAESIGSDLPSLADRVAEWMQWTALAIRFRGCGRSTGDFSLQGWVDDVRSAVDFLEAEVQPDTVWLCGFGSGGSVSIVAASDDERITGVSMAGSPSDFNDWASNPNRLLAHAKKVGAIRSPNFPEDPERWKAQLRTVNANHAMEKLRGRPLLILHGTDDDVVPSFDALALRDAYTDGTSDEWVELRQVKGGGHLLRHDPRATAVLLGWLTRSRLKLRGLSQPADGNGFSKATGPDSPDPGHST